MYPKTTTKVRLAMKVAKPSPMFGAMFSSQNEGEDWEKAQLEKNVMAAKAGRNMIRRSAADRS